jgi:hypothetical protein
MGYKPLFAYGIFKVIYSPFKAFKEIIEKPKYIGPILIMILFIVANVGSVYVVISKTYVEQTLPTASQLDEWTENSTLWIPTPRVNYDDYINGTYYGNKSIEFSVINDTQIWMQLNNTEPVNCSGIEGYKNMSFRIKLICPAITKLNNASLLLYSSPADYFYYNLTKHFTPFNSTVWNNLTIPTGPESGSWLNRTNEADWSNITRLKFEFTWPENTNITVLLDGLFFRGVFKSELENVASYIFNYSSFGFMQFTIKWVILSGIIYIMSKAFGGKAVWRPLLILVGFALITLFIQAVINTATYAAAPTLYYPLEFFGGVEGEFEIAYKKILEQTWLVSLISNYVRIAIYIWTIALCAIALRLLTEISWTKSFLIATVAYFVSVLVETFILGY